MNPEFIFIDLYIYIYKGSNLKILLPYSPLEDLYPI